MKIDRLTRIFDALGSTAQPNRTQTSPETQAASDEEAVKVSSRITDSGDSGSVERQRKLAALKEQVQSGSYKVDSEQTAQAVYRDLLA